MHNLIAIASYLVFGIWYLPVFSCICLYLAIFCHIRAYRGL